MADGPQPLAKKPIDLARETPELQVGDASALGQSPVSQVGVLAAGRLAGHGMSPQNMLALQRMVGNQAATRVMHLQRTPAPEAATPRVQTQPAHSEGLLSTLGGFFGSMRTLQRKVYKDGGKGAVSISATAKSTGKWVTTKASVQPGGSNHLADIQNRGFPGFKKGKDEYAGGRAFNNNPAKDGSRLPYSGGQTYQEWDVNPCVADGARDGERIVTSSDGKLYYSNNHYDDFTEFEA